MVDTLAINGAAVRFWSKVVVSDDCWQWTGNLAADGYGRFSIVQKDGAKRWIYAHRLSYVSHNGAIPSGTELDHLCRNRGCVKPAHLEAVSRRTNVLRGKSPAALNAVKTHCVQGHEFSPENTYIRRSGGRDCRKCNTAAQLRYKARKKVEA